MTQATFSAMGLAEPLLRAIEALNYTTPTPVQAEAIPKALEGGDWMVSSQTGSGKTVAFLVPTLQRILNSGESAMKAASGPIGLVLCPTRELAQQVAQDAIGLVRQSKGLRIATIMGGTPFAKQIAGLRGAQLVIATPGRLLDLVNQRKIQLGQVKTLVVDEADRMLDLGFAEDLEAIHSLCKGRDQTLMFSATFAAKIMALGAELMDNPQRLALASATGQNTNIEQRLFWADNYNHKRKLLTHWLNDADVDQAIVFASTQSDTEVLARDLEQDGLSAIALHGAMPQAVRNHRLQGLRDGKFKILVATDVAARGIDVPSITHVINFGLPMKAEDYTHRIGRTGRAGREGLAITIAEQGERRKIQGIERFIQQTIPVSEVAGMEPKPFSRSSAKPSGGRGGREGGRPTTRNRSEGAPRSYDSAPRSYDSAPRSYDRSAQAPAGEWANKAPRSGNGERRTFAGAGAGAPRPAFAERSFGDRPRTDRSDRAPREGGFADRQPRERSFADRAPRDNAFADRAPRERTFGDRPARTADTRTSFRTDASAPSAPRRAPSRPSSFSERSSFAGRTGDRARRG